VLSDLKEGFMAKYDRRLATRVTADVDQRLRHAWVASGSKSLSAYLTDVLDRTLPTNGELASQLHGAGGQRPPYVVMDGQGREADQADSYGEAWEKAFAIKGRIVTGDGTPMGDLADPEMRQLIGMLRAARNGS
jgi:hypothetical protein